MIALNSGIAAKIHPELYSMTFKLGFSIVAFTAVLSACGGGSGSGSSSGGGSTNSAPVVDAGAAQTAVQGDVIQLAATATDSDGDTLSYTWSQTGTQGTFSNTNIEDPTFTAPNVNDEETLTLTLTVSDGTVSRSDTVTVTVSETAPVVLSAPWIVNTTNERSKNIMDGGQFVEVDVLSATQAGDFISIQTNTIPSYEIEVTQEILDWYNDYQSGAYSGTTSLAIGNIVEFGDDVGLTVSNCTAGGTGWWPGGGGACAESNPGTYDIPVTPTVATEACYTGAGPVGLWVNGVPIYNWTDTFSYNNEGIWSYYAVPFRSKGMDICLGHGGGGFNNYHHHSYNECIRQVVNDEGTDHSPIYGYAGDGYPIHGPYHDATTLAKSCWAVRDYSATSATGCGTDGVRSCQYVDATDISQGFENVSAGPTTSTLVGIDYDDVAAEAGFYVEDYYYESSCTAQSDEYLDQYNGHDHDGLGYHYHTTVDANMLPTFPLAPAIQWRGEAAGSFSCNNGPVNTAMGGPGGGG